MTDFAIIIAYAPSFSEMRTLLSSPTAKASKKVLLPFVCKGEEARDSQSSRRVNVQDGAGQKEEEGEGCTSAAMSDPGDGEEEAGASVPSFPPGSEAETRDDDGAASNDVDRSGAMRVLRELHDANVVSDEQFAFLSSKYATLHSSLLETMENDRKLLSKARTLNKRLTDDRNRLEALSNHGDAASHIELLREDVEHAEQEAAVCSEREQLAHVEVSELASQRDDMHALIEDAHAQYSVELEPQVRQLRDDIATLRDENSETAKRRTNTENERNNVLEKDRETSRAIEAVKDAKGESEADYARATVLPEKIRKQAEAVAISQNALRAQEGFPSASKATWRAICAKSPSKPGAPRCPAA